MSLEKTYLHYKDRATIYLVYIREAHPVDGWYTGFRAIKDPRTLEERNDVAGQCMSTLKFTIPCLVDGIDNAVEKAYAGWPDRIYVIDPQGKIAYKSGPGPRGFRPREMEVALKKLLGELGGTFVTPEDKPLPRAEEKAPAPAEVIETFRKAWTDQPGVRRPLDDQGWKARVMALCELVKLGPKALPALTTALDDRDAEVRALAAQALGFLGEASAADKLEQLLAKDSDPTVRLYAADALGMIGGMQPKPHYEKVAQEDRNKDVREHLLGALARKGEGLPPAVRKRFESFRPDAIDTARLDKPDASR